MANPSTAAAITVSSGAFGTWALVWMNLSKNSNRDSSSRWMQFSKSLIVFIPGWYPWKVETSSALTWPQDQMDNGFNEVYQSCVMSSTSMMSDFARIWVFPRLMLPRSHNLLGTYSGLTFRRRPECEACSRLATDTAEVLKTKVKWGHMHFRLLPGGYHLVLQCFR